MIFILICIILIALLFEFINGFHDVANVVATPIASKSLSPSQAILVASIFNFFGAFIGTSVATTISKGLIDTNVITYLVLISSLTIAIGWNLFTWYLGIPSSSSHALIGSLVGSAIAASNIGSVNYKTLLINVIVPMTISPLLSFFLSLLIVTILFVLFNGSKKSFRQFNSYIREFQIFSTSLLALSHGSNDAQKTMSIITLSLFSFGFLNSPSSIPIWVTFLCAITMAFGTLFGGTRIVKTLTSRIAKIGPINALAAEMSSGMLILMASYFGFPISTTQAASGSVMGAGYLENRGLNWSIVYTMMVAWLLTLPCCTVISFCTYNVLTMLFVDFSV